MKIAFGKQQGDAWIRNRVGRITGSRIADVVSKLTRASGAKKAGDPSAKRDTYKLELIAERLTGRAKDHYVSPAMEHGTDTEDEAALYYEGVMRQMVEPVGFILHPQYDFTGASPDRLVGSEGLLECKCPETTTHLEYVMAGQIPSEYLPQVAWELACTGRKWADFVSFDPRINDAKLRYFYRRVSRADLVWGEYAGEAVINYFTSEVLKLNAEIEFWFAERGITPVAPYPVELVDDETGEVLDPYDDSKTFSDNCAFMDQYAANEAI